MKYRLESSKYDICEYRNWVRQREDVGAGQGYCVKWSVYSGGCAFSLCGNINTYKCPGEPFDNCCWSVYSQNTLWIAHFFTWLFSWKTTYFYETTSEMKMNRTNGYILFSIFSYIVMYLSCHNSRGNISKMKLDILSALVAY